MSGFRGVPQTPKSTHEAPLSTCSSCSYSPPTPFICFRPASLPWVHSAFTSASQAPLNIQPGQQRAWVMKWPLDTWICLLPSVIWLWEAISIQASSDGQNTVTSNNNCGFHSLVLYFTWFSLCELWSKRTFPKCWHRKNQTGRKRKASKLGIVVVVLLRSPS